MIIYRYKEVIIMNKTYKVLDIACYVINRHNDICTWGISNLRLQKLLYFIQAEFLMKGRVCFKEEIEAWPYGPVIPEVYKEFSGYGSAKIPNREFYIDELDFKFFNDIEIDKEDKKIIDDVIRMAKDYSDFELVNITHNQKPWTDAIKGGNKTIIEKEEMRGYFKNV